MALRLSLLMHFVVIMLMVLGLPSLTRTVNNDSTIVAQVVPISALTNIAVKKPKESKVEKDEVKKKPEAKPEPKKEEKPKTNEEKPKVKPAEVKVPNDKSPAKSSKKENSKQKEEAFDKMIQKTLEKEKSKQEKVKELDKALEGFTNKPFNDSMPMSMSEIDYIKSTISQHWNTSSFSGASQAAMQVTLSITLDAEANVVNVVAKNKGNGSNYYQAFVNSCIRAVRSASPLKLLPLEKYHTWKEIELSFDSSGMII